MPRPLLPSTRPIPHSLGTLVAGVGMIWIVGCGEQTEPVWQPRSEAPIEALDARDRWQTQSIRLSVKKPLIIRWDTATGEVTERLILGDGSFKTVARELPPGASLDPIEVGRYLVDVIPGRRGSALLRLDTVTGQVWLVHLNVKPRRWIAIPVQGSAAKAARAVEALGQAQQNAGPSGTPHASDEPKPPTLEGLIGLLGEDNPQDVRAGIPNMVVLYYPDRSAQALLPFLHDDDPLVVVSVIEALPMRRDSNVVASLQPLLSHDDDRVAEATRRKLGGAK